MDTIDIFVESCMIGPFTYPVSVWRDGLTWAQQYHWCVSNVAIRWILTGTVTDSNLIVTPGRLSVGAKIGILGQIHEIRQITFVLPRRFDSRSRDGQEMRRVTEAVIRDLTSGDSMTIGATGTHGDFWVLSGTTWELGSRVVAHNFSYGNTIGGPVAPMGRSFTMADGPEPRTRRQRRRWG
jgi:hypothetical protein